jgi:hypothetical protein
MKYGFKLSTDDDKNTVEDGIDFVKNKVFSFIELFVVPDTKDNLNNFIDLNVPIIIHAPHEEYGCNLSTYPMELKTQKIYGRINFLGR